MVCSFSLLKFLYVSPYFCLSVCPSVCLFTSAVSLTSVQSFFSGAHHRVGDLARAVQAVGDAVLVGHRLKKNMLKKTFRMLKRKIIYIDIVR